MFNSNVEIVGKFNSSFPDDIIKNEPMFFRSSFDYAWENGGIITKTFLKG